MFNKNVISSHPKTAIQAIVNMEETITNEICIKKNY